MKKEKNHLAASVLDNLRFFTLNENSFKMNHFCLKNNI